MALSDEGKMADQDQNKNNGYSKGYGKRPLWQWVVLYIVVGGALYFGTYYLWVHRSGASTTQSSPY